MENWASSQVQKGTGAEAEVLQLVTVILAVIPNFLVPQKIYL